MTFVAAFLPDPGSRTLNVWRIHRPFGRLRRGLIEFTAVAGVVLTIAKALLKRL